MNIIRWQQPAVGRLADLFESSFGSLSRNSQLFSSPAPALDVYEDKENFTVRAELPGMKKEEISVSLQDGDLTISGERKSETKREDAEVHRSECFAGRFERTVSLPVPVAADRVQAKYQDGILTVTLPKTEEAKPKQIAVNVN